MINDIRLTVAILEGFLDIEVPRSGQMGKNVIVRVIVLPCGVYIEGHSNIRTMKVEVARASCHTRNLHRAAASREATATPGRNLRTRGVVEAVVAEAAGISARNPQREVALIHQPKALSTRFGYVRDR